MLTVRRRLITVVVLVVVLSLAVVWLLLAGSSRKVVNTDVSVQPQPAMAATVDRPQTESRGGRESMLDEYLKFDPELAPWLNRPFEKHSAAGVRPGTSVGGPHEQVASAPVNQRGSDVR